MNPRRMIVGGKAIRGFSYLGDEATRFSDLPQLARHAGSVSGAKPETGSDEFPED